MSLEQVLARSRQRASLTERKRFTVAADKAFDKQKLFAMQSPGEWALRAFQCAAFSEAELVGVDARVSQVTIGWVGGRPIAADQLDDLFSYLLTDRADPETRHLAQLALAIAGALASKPKEVRVESMGPDGATCMIIDQKGVASVGDPGPGIDGTYITVLMDHWFFSRFQSPTETTEGALLRQKTAYARTPLLINPCSSMEYSRFPYNDLESPVRGARGERRWALALQARCELVIVVGGVTVEHIRVPEIGMAGVVWDDSLRLSADQSKIVRDARWRQLVLFLGARTHRWLASEGHVLPDGLDAFEVDGTADEADDAPLATAPVPEFVDQVAPRPPLPRPARRDKPLAYVWPSDVETLAEAVDPLQLPIEVAILTDAQAQTLRSEGVSLHRLTPGAGIAFVRRMAVAGEVLAEKQPNFGDVQLTLRLHPGDGAPPWGRAGAPLPLTVVGRGRAIYVGGVGIDLPGCSVQASGSIDVAHVEAVVLQHALALAFPLAGHDSEQGRRLLLHLVQHVAAPQLVQRGDAVGLELALPSELSGALDVPLIEGHTLRQVLDLAGTDEVLEVEDVARYEPLESLVGFGHLVDGKVNRGTLVGVGFDGTRWVPMQRVPDLSVCQFLSVLPTFRAPPLPVGWKRIELPLPLFAMEHTHLDRWEVGAARLLSALPAAASRSVRLEALLPVVTVQLSRLCGVRGAALRPFRGEGAAVALGGLTSTSDDVLPCTVDLLRALAPDVVLPLRLDDDPSLWMRPDEHDWVVRMPVDVAGIDGWLGLRRPFDATGGVLRRRADGSTEILAAYDDRFPAHGVLRAGVDVTAQNLLLPGLQLYRVLEDYLRSHPSDLDAQAYARQQAQAPDSAPSLGAAAWTQRLQAVVDAASRGSFEVRGLERPGRFSAEVYVQVGRVAVILRGGPQVFREPRAVEVLLIEAVRGLSDQLRENDHPFDLLGGLEVLSAGR